MITAWTGTSDPKPTTEEDLVSVPAVCSIEIAPTLGPATGATSPINVAARNVFGFIRANQTVNAAYNQVTLMMYLVAMTAVYSFYAWCARIYGLLSVYDHRNRALPLALFKAMGLNFSDLHQNKADFRYWLNNFANKVGALVIPSNMSYTKRAMWLYQNVFKDGMNDKAQVYIYTPAAFFKYNAVSADDVPALDYLSIAYEVKNNTSGGLKMADLVRIGETLINPLFQNNIINTISGDIIKAYGFERVWQLVPIPEQYEVLPSLELNVLDQIHNAFMPLQEPVFGKTQGMLIDAQQIISSVVTETIDSANAISFLSPQYHYNGLLSSVPSRTLKQASWGWNGVIIDFDRQDVTPADIMVATRLTSLQYEVDAIGASQIVPPSKSILCGSEIITAIKTWKAANSNQTFVSRSHRLVTDSLVNSTDLRPFYKHPIVYAIDSTLSFSSDIENWTFLDKKNLFKLHETALLSEFHVPLSGRLIK